MHPAPKWLSLVFMALFASNTARADDAPSSGRTSSLSWIRMQGAESCVATQKLAQGVEARLGRRVFVAASHADISVEGYVERTKLGYVASFSVRDSDGALLGTRTLTEPGPSCDALTDALVLALAVMIDPEATDGATPEHAAEPPPSPPVPEPPPPIPPPPARAPAPPPPPPPPSWELEMDASAALGVGILPGAAAGTSMTAMMRPPRFWPLRLGGSFFPGSSVDLERGARATVSLAYGQAVVCPLYPAIGRLRVMACAGAQVGVLRGSGTGFVHNATDESIEVNAAATLQATFTIVKPLIALASVTLDVPALQRSLTYQRADGSSDELFRPSAIGGAGGVGLGIHFF